MQAAAPHFPKIPSIIDIPTMMSRPSLADFQEFNRRSRVAAPGDEAGNRARHGIRVAAWMTKRREQNAWYRRSGLAESSRRRQALFARKDAIEQELLALVTVPGAGSMFHTGGFDA
jgi:hypothetical protein